MNDEEPYRVVVLSNKEVAAAIVDFALKKAAVSGLDAVHYEVDQNFTVQVSDPENMVRVRIYKLPDNVVLLDTKRCRS